MARQDQQKLSNQDYIIPAPKIGDVVGIHPKTVRQMSAAGRFPERIILSQRKHGYLASEVFSWLKEHRG